MTVIGWHEAIALPDLGIDRIYAKIDTAADHSTLHAQAIVRVNQGEDGAPCDSVDFTPPLLRRQASCEEWPRGGVRRVRAPIIDERVVRSSNGTDDVRLVIATRLVLGGSTLNARFTLTNRDGLRFPVLIGRSALTGEFLVDAGRCHLTEDRASCGEM